ncbi:MAG: hypothetical protein NT094_02300 [Candidatus Staskawiczbacteria bacterium]|nr:hypothetical protein [Candidatus Staskawiczbacteria bacterium]
MNLAYEGLTKRFKYKINFIETKEENNIEFNDLRLSFKKTTHSQDNLAIKIINNKVSMVYSGDGAPRKIDDFYKDLDLLIQETYFYDQEKISHASIVNAIKFSEENNIKCLTLTHINRDFRKNDLLKMRDKIKSDKVKIIIPEPFDEYNL